MSNLFFRRVKTPGLAHVSYVIGSRGEAAVIDPRRDVDEYIEIARMNGLDIRYVFVTHRQEDFVLGSAELARLLGARIVTGDHELFGPSDQRLRDGDTMYMGDVVFRALHTPGHTPESTCYAVYLPDAPGRAWGVFTGDSLFIGEAGRTDLPDPERTGENAGLLYDMINLKLSPLGDQALLLPAHGAGSVCGGNIANRDDSTIGLERSYNPAFTRSRESFIESKLKERLPRPPYFRTMEVVNLMGGLPMNDLVGALRALSPRAFEQASTHGIVIDTRAPEAFAGGHIPGSYSIWLGGLSVFAGWVANAETPVFLVLPEQVDPSVAVRSLARVGIDRIEGMLAGGFEAWRNAGMPIRDAGTISPRELAGGIRVHERPVLLDVREDAEFEDEGHIPGAKHIYVGHLEEQIGALDSEFGKSRMMIVTCSVGNRASLATSILRRYDFAHVYNLLGGMTAWQKLGLPTVTGPEEAQPLEVREAA